MVLFIFIPYLNFLDRCLPFYDEYLLKWRPVWQGLTIGISMVLSHEDCWLEKTVVNRR